MTSNNDPLPDFCIRGIREKKHIIEEFGPPSLEIFLPLESTAKHRDDKGEEVSVNWEDDDEALKFTIECRDEKSGNFKFPQGVVKLPLDEIERLNNQPTMDNPLFVERKIEDDNPYHGNIVYKSGLRPLLKRMIASSLATHTSQIFTRDGIE